MLAAIAAVVICAAPAFGDVPPTCATSEIWARPGLQRHYEIHCAGATGVTISGQPAHGSLGNVRAPYGYLLMEYVADTDAPEQDSFELTFSGPGGSTAVAFTVHVVPLSVNTAPVCDPVNPFQYSDGSQPVTVQFGVHCSDAEHDTMTIDAGGAPGTLTGVPSYASDYQSHPWFGYTSAASSGTETMSYWATDQFGARSADAPITVSFGPVLPPLPPTCQTNPTSDFPPYPIYARPGATRSFAIRCVDPNGDDFLVALASAPKHGHFTSFAVGNPQRGYWGLERWVNITYVPDAVSTDPDPFTVSATGPDGATTSADMTIVPGDTNDQGGASCWGWAGHANPEFSASSHCAATTPKATLCHLR